MFKRTKYFAARSTSPEPGTPGAGPVASAAGGGTWTLDDWARLDRFLILGTDGGTLQVGEQALTLDRARVVARCLDAGGVRTVDRIVAISEAGRAPSNDPAIFALAIAAKLGDDATRRAAYAALPKVCRIGTHLMQFAHHAQGFGGWGRGMRKAVGAWFNARPAVELAYQLAKYQARDGWSNRDLLRLAHPRAASASHDRLFAWAVKGELSPAAVADPALALIAAIDELKTIDNPFVAARLIRDRRIPRACVPAELLQLPEVWDALLAAMPLAAMIRNLATMTRVGLLAPGASATRQVAVRLGDPHRVARAGVHPIAVLSALMTYQAGRCARGATTWAPVAAIVDALEAAFHASLGALAGSGKRCLLALDVSGSMAEGSVAGVPKLSPRIASAALALAAAASERDGVFVAFASAAGGPGRGATPGITALSISPRQRLDEVVRQVSALPQGRTDCALPMIWARDNRVDIDTFCVYTDDETSAGDVHPVQALCAYRDARGIAAKLVVVGMTSPGFSIADPDDAGMIDVVGFDASTPPVIADFARA